MAVSLSASTAKMHHASQSSHNTAINGDWHLLVRASQAAAMPAANGNVANASMHVRHGKLAEAKGRASANADAPGRWP